MANRIFQNKFLLRKTWNHQNIAFIGQTLKCFYSKWPSGWMPKMVIFDKHGTLVNFHTTWTPWVKNLIERLNQATNKDLTTSVYECLDVCRFTSKTRTGILSQGNSQQLKTQLQNVLVKTIGLSHEKSIDTIEKCFLDEKRNDLLERVKATELISSKVKELFEELKQKSIKISVCTSDDRKVTELSLKRVGLYDMVDAIVCGDDDSIIDKPMATSVLKLCRETGIKCQDTLLVGDQPADMLMGKAAGTAFNVGVLSGVGTRLELTPPADFIIPSVADLMPLLFNKDNVRSSSSVHTVTQAPERKAALVIFDKDGTLINFESMWTPWAVNFIEKLEEKTKMDLYYKCLAALGYCHQSNKWRAGIFAEGTVKQNQECILEILEEEGMSTKDAEEAINSVWSDGDHSSKDESNDKSSIDNASGQLQTISNLRVLFESLHHHGVKVAICTADNRKPTEQFLKERDLDRYVDIMVCGDDNGAVPKPAPDNAYSICQQLGIDPAEAIVVGDTIADLGMGRSASLGATIGVLSGVGDVEDLAETADHMISDVGQLLPLVLDTEAAQKTHEQLMTFTTPSTAVVSSQGSTGS